MKELFACLLCLGWIPASAIAGSAVFRYGDFGPQAAVYELIGYEWWQWEPHGDSDPTAKPDIDIKVVVYWDEALDAIKARFPVDRNNKQDYRYLEYGKAKKHLEDLIVDFDKSGLNADSLRATLHALNGLRRYGDAIRKGLVQPGCAIASVNLLEVEA